MPVYWGLGAWCWFIAVSSVSVCLYAVPCSVAVGCSLLPVVIIAWCGTELHTVTNKGYKLHTVTQNKLCTVLVRSLHHFGATPSCQPLLLLTSSVMESCKLAARWRWWVAGKPCP